MPRKKRNGQFFRFKGRTRSCVLNHADRGSPSPSASADSCAVSRSASGRESSVPSRDTYIGRMGTGATSLWEIIDGTENPSDTRNYINSESIVVNIVSDRGKAAVSGVRLTALPRAHVQVYFKTSNTHISRALYYIKYFIVDNFIRYSSFLPLFSIFRNVINVASATINLWKPDAREREVHFRDPYRKIARVNFFPLLQQLLRTTHL